MFVELDDKKFINLNKVVRIEMYSQDDGSELYIFKGDGLSEIGRLQIPPDDVVKRSKITTILNNQKFL